VGNDPTNGTDPSGLATDPEGSPAADGSLTSDTAPKPPRDPLQLGLAHDLNSAHEDAVVRQYFADSGNGNYLFPEFAAGNYEALQALRYKFSEGASSDVWAPGMQDELKAATVAARAMIQKALDALTDDEKWAQVKKRGTITWNDPNPQSNLVLSSTDKPVVYLSDPANRAAFIKELKTILHRLNQPDPITYILDMGYARKDSKLTTYLPANEPPPGEPLANPDGMYVHNGFFRKEGGAAASAADQATAVVHELGRYVLGLNGMGDGTFEDDDIVRFDTLIDYLNR
jgi:hypothetical protein